MHISKYSALGRESLFVKINNACHKAGNVQQNHVEVIKLINDIDTAQ